MKLENAWTNRAPDGELVVDGGVLAGEEPDDSIRAELLRGQRLRVVPEEEVRSEPHELHRHVLRNGRDKIFIMDANFMLYPISIQ